MSKKRHRLRVPKQGRARRGRSQVPKQPPFLVDIAMCVYGEWSMLERAIGCVEQAAEGLEGRYRIILVDNGTPVWSPADNPEESITPEVQAEGVKQLLRPEDRFIRLDENVGYPGGMNTAVSRGKAPLILILTSDVYLEPSAITIMVKEMDDPQIGVAAPLLMFPKDESPHGPPGGVQSAGISFNIQGDPFHIFMGWTPDHPKVNRRRDMQAVTGACFLTRRALWDQIGGFASVYGLGTYEDMEFCFATRSMGYKVVFNPAARGYHYVGGSIKQGAGRSGFPLTVNATIFKGRWAQNLVWDEYLFY